MLCCAGGLGMTVMLEPLEEVPEGAMGGIVQLEPLEEGSGGAVVDIEEGVAQIIEPLEEDPAPDTEGTD